MPARSPRPCGRSAIAESIDLTEGLAEGLAPLARLALAYAPRSGRGDWLTLLALDARLAGVVRTAREPILAQLKLAWWRDRLSADPAGWPKGEPLLARLSGWTDPAGLVPLVDGWEGLLAEDPAAPAMSEAFAGGRAAAMEALAARLGCSGGAAAEAARQWALADLALDGFTPLEGAPRGPVSALARAMRPLAVLAGVSLRAVGKGGAAALYRPGAYFTAIRIGLLGA